MKKNKIKLLVSTISVATLIGAITPIISSCASSQKNAVVYDPVNKLITIDAESFFGRSTNVFQTFNNLNSFKNEVVAQNIESQQNATNNNSSTENKIVDSNKLKLFKDKLNGFMQTWLDENNLTFNDLQIDLSTLKLDGWNVSFNAKVVNNPNLLSKITFKNNKVSKQQIDKWTQENCYCYQASTYFKGQTLATIQKLSNDEILNNVILPNGSIIWNNIDPNKGPITSSITTENNGNSILSILIFTPEKGVGKLLIEQSSIDINFGTPSQNIINIFGSNPKNIWSNIANLYLTPISNLTFNNIDANPGLYLESYDDAIKNQTIQSKIAQYKNKTTIKLNNQSYKLNFLNKLQLDLTFFFKNYFSELQELWEIPSLLTTNIFITNNLTINSNQTISGNIGIEIKNTSNSDKNISIPITNQTIKVPANNAITIIINFNNSEISPYLTLKDNINNQGYLTLGFSNLTVQTSLTNLNIQSFANQSAFYFNDNSSRVTKSSTIQNIYPYSYSLNTIVSNVGYGNNFVNSLDKISQSYNSLTEETLKSTKLTNLNNQYQTFLNVIKGVQGIFLKIANNPTIVNFLQSINDDIYEIVNAITGDSNISYIISDLFSNKKVSEYLYSNINRIIALIEKNAASSSQLDIILKMLQSIHNANPTLDNMREWVKSIIGLYPTLEKLLMGAVANFMPLIKQIMTSLSDNDPPIFSFLFSNFDYIFNFLKSQGAGLSIIDPLSKYLDTLVTFANRQTKTRDTTISNNTEKYNNIRILDPFVYGLTQRGDNSYGFFQMLADIINGFSPNNTISPILTSISNLFTNNFYINVDSSLKIKDYSSNTWKNTTSFIGTISKYNPGDPKLVSLYDQLGKCIRAIFNVYLDNSNTPVDLFTMLANNIKLAISQNDFSFDQQNHSVTQTLNLRFNLNQDIKWDTMPICVLLDNSTLSLGQGIDGAIKLLLGDLKNGGLAKLFPTDIVAKKTVNFVNLNYTCTNSKLSPSIDANGQINWRYQATENLAIETNDIWTSSNTRYNTMNKNKKTSQYYGSKFSSFYNLIKKIINIPGGWTNYSSVITNLNNPIKIDNYNSNISNSNLVVNQLLPTDSLNEYLSSLVQNPSYFNWIVDQETNKEECLIKLPNDFATELQKYFNFSSLINQNNPYIDFDYGFSASHNKIITDSYSYTFTINFSLPIIYMDSSGNRSLVSSLSFTI